jgi:hypothetical protein
MISSSISIVGCGLVGSNIAIAISENKLCETIRLYDYSTTVKNENYFPFKNVIPGIKKADIVALNILKLNENMKVFCNYNIVENKIDDELVIDCRDYKDPCIFSDITISCDSHSLILDSRKNRGNTDFSHPYYYSKLNCSFWIKIQVDFINKYLKEKRYLENKKILCDFKDNIIFEL